MNDEYKKNYGLKLKEYRKKANLTQEEVVKKAQEFLENNCDNNDITKVCFNQNQLSNWENGKYFPHHINRFLLSIVYNIPIEELETNYPNNEDEELENYLKNLIQEDEIYISENDMIFESEDELKEVIGDTYNAKSKNAFINGTKINIQYLTKLHLNKNWDIQKKTQYLIDLYVAQGLMIPKELIEILSETDPEKKSKMYYEYYVSFYNGSLYASKKKNNLK